MSGIAPCFAICRLLPGPARSQQRSSTAALDCRYASSSLAPPLRNSRYRSSRCCSISSKRSDSAAPSKRKAAMRSRTIRPHSGMLYSCHPADGSNEFLPAPPLRGKCVSALMRQAVITPPSLFGLFHPAAVDPAFLLEPVEQRIQRRDVESQGAARSDLNQPRNVVPMTRLILEQR